MVKKSFDVVVAVGSNVGDRAGNIRRAVGYVSRASVVVKDVSRVYETRPFGGAKQRNYYNAAFRADSALGPFELLDVLKSVERKLGRRTSARKWSPRPADLDLLFYGDGKISSPRLSVPHPRIKERDFVLVPLRDLFGARKLPVFGKTAADLTARIPRTKRTISRAGFGIGGSYEKKPVCQGSGGEIARNGGQDGQNHKKFRRGSRRKS